MKSDGKINIAIILPSLDKGGVSSAALNLINYLNEELYNKFIVLYDGNICDYKINFKIIDLKSPKTNFIFSKLITQYQRYSRLKKFKTENNIDISISLKDNPNITNFFAKCNDKIIMTVHTTPSRDYKGLHGRFYRYLIGRYFNKADKVVTVSAGIKNDLIKNYNVQPCKIQTIYNFIDVNHIKKLAEEPIENDLKILFQGERTAITIGRLETPKGHWHLIRAFKIVINDLPDSKLVIVGDGSLKLYLSELVKNLEMTKNIFLIGNRDNPYKYLKSSELFVLSSLYEGFGIVLIEAMACGLPVLSTDCASGPSEILLDEHSELCGVLVSVPDGKKYSAGDPFTLEERVMAREIIKMITNKTESNKFRELSLKRAEAFSSKNIILNWDNLIYELMKGDR